MYCTRALAQDRNVFSPVSVVNVPSKIQSQELSIVILEQGQVWFLEGCTAASLHAQWPDDEAMIMRVPAIWVRWGLVRLGTL